MRRTAAADTEFAGTQIAKGDKVVMWYASTSFDERVARDPMRFDVGREANPHDAFGGGGPHHCLGAFLARLEISVLLEEMAKRSIRLQRNRRRRPSPVQLRPRRAVGRHGTRREEMNMTSALHDHRHAEHRPPRRRT